MIIRDRQTDIQAGRHSQITRDRQTDVQVDKKTGRYTGRYQGRQADTDRKQETDDMI